MKSVLVLSLAGSALAAPSFGSFLDALFGGGNDNNNAPGPDTLPSFPPIGTGSGLPFPFPTATGAPFPTGSGDAFPSPLPGSNKRDVKPKALHINYQLAPTAAPAIKRRALKYRQLGTGSPALPSFSLLDPNDTPTATAPATATSEEAGLPTELPTGFPTGLPTELPSGLPTELPTDFPSPPTGYPTAPFPFPTGNSPLPTDAPEPPFPFPTAPAGTGAPDLPSTLETVTRGPRPTAAPESGLGGEEEGEHENGNAWLEWISQLLTGGGKGEN